MKKQNTDLFTDYILEHTTKSGYTYIGKTENLKRAEALISEILVDELTYKDNPVKISAQIQNSPQLREVERCFEKEFGFKKFYISVKPTDTRIITRDSTIDLFSRFYDPESYEDESTLDKINNTVIANLELDQRTNFSNLPPNALVRDSRYDFPTLLHKKDKYYDYSHKYHCLVFTTGSSFAILTAEEIMASLLHETGHNMESSVCRYIDDVLHYIMWIKDLDWQDRTEIMYLINGVLDELGLHKLITLKVLSFYDILLQNKYVVRILDAIFYIFSILTDIKFLVFPLKSFMGIFNTIKELLTLTPLQILYRVVKQIEGAQSEYYADNFALIYGYGPAHISGIDKELNEIYVGRYNPFIRKIGKWWIFKHNAVIFDSLYTINCILNDVHLGPQARVRAQVDDLEKLKNVKDFPPDIKRRIKEDYDETLKAYNKYLQAENKGRKDMAMAFVRKANEKIFNGKFDYRTYFMFTKAMQSGCLTPTKIRKVK